jgi:hypothetical protein
MKRRLIHFSLALVLLVGTSGRGVLAKGATVKLAITGTWLTKPLEVTNRLALVNVWDGTRATQGRFDFPKPFIGSVTSEPPASLPRFKISFYVNDGAQVQVLYTVRYVPDPNTGRGYVYLPGHNDPDANWVINRPADGKWSYASVEWSAVINSQLAATTR